MTTKLKRYICEGCVTVVIDRWPDGWVSTGTSARKGKVTGAFWCADCQRDGTMRKYSRGTLRSAIAAAYERDLLDELQTAEARTP